MKDLLWTNFQHTRATGVPTTFTVDGVSIEMRKRAASAPAKAKTTKSRRPTKKANRPKEKPPELPAKASKPAAARRTEPTPQ